VKEGKEPTAMRLMIATSLSACVCAAAICYGQGTFQTITFDGPPILAPGTARVVTNYYESGMYFTPLPGYSGFGRRGATTNALWPDNGTAFIQAALAPPESVMFSFTNGSSFGVRSVDLSEYSTVVPGAETVDFIGYRPDGSTVTNSFTTPGYGGTGPLTFQTYYFGPEFSGLNRVAVPTFGSMDNLGVIVPEPRAGALLLLGGTALGALRLRRRRGD